MGLSDSRKSGSSFIYVLLRYITYVSPTLSLIGSVAESMISFEMLNASVAESSVISEQ